MQRFHEGDWERTGRVEVTLRSGPVVFVPKPARVGKRPHNLCWVTGLGGKKMYISRDAPRAGGDHRTFRGPSLKLQKFPLTQMQPPGRRWERGTIIAWENPENPEIAEFTWNSLIFVYSWWVLFLIVIRSNGYSKQRKKFVTETIIFCFTKPGSAACEMLVSYKYS